MAREMMVFLHGLGQTPQSFSEQVRELPDGLQAAAPWLRGLRPGSAHTFSLRDSAAEVSSAITMHAADRAYLVGVSLGALVALQASLDDERVAGLVLAAAPVSPPGWVLKLQGAVLRMASRRRLAAQGLNKEALQQVTRALAETDVSGRLEEIAAPTLLLCGSRDRTNQPAARLLSERIPDARLEIIEGGTALNIDNPVEFNRLTYEFVSGLRSR